MIRREAPRRIVDPCPAPRRLPDPVAVAIRRPVGRHRVRRPHVAVLRVVAPCAVRIEVLIAGHVARHVARGDRAVFGGVAACGPLVEGVGAGCAVVRDLLQVRAGEGDLLAGRDRHLATVAIDGRAAVAHRHRRAAAIRRDVDAIVARRGDAKREIRRVDFIRRAGRQRAHARRQRALRDFQLRVAVVEIEHVEARRFAQTHRGRADVHLRARAPVVPELVAGRERTVDLRVRPVAGAGRFGRHRALHVVEPRDASRRIDVLRAGRHVGLHVWRRSLRERGLGGETEWSSGEQGVAGQTTESQ